MRIDGFGFVYGNGFGTTDRFGNGRGDGRYSYGTGNGNSQGFKTDFGDGDSTGYGNGDGMGSCHDRGSVLYTMTPFAYLTYEGKPLDNALDNFMFHLQVVPLVHRRV